MDLVSPLPLAHANRESTSSQLPRPRAGSAFSSTATEFTATQSAWTAGIVAPSGYRATPSERQAAAVPRSGESSPSWITSMPSTLSSIAHSTSPSPYPFRSGNPSQPLGWIEGSRPPAAESVPVTSSTSAVNTLVPALVGGGIDSKVEYSSSAASSLPTSPCESMNMSSSVSTSMDSTVNMGIRSSAYGWPCGVVDSNNNALSDVNSSAVQNLSGLPSPSGTRSATASPLRGNLTAEHGDMKLGRDEARQDAKTSYSTQRTDGTSPSYVSPASSSTGLPTSGLTSTGTPAVVPAGPAVAPPPSSLSMYTPASSSYGPSFSAPATPLESQASVFPNLYSPVHPYMSVDYTQGSRQAPPSHYGAQSSVSVGPQDSASLMYTPVTSVLGSAPHHAQAPPPLHTSLPLSLPPSRQPQLPSPVGQQPHAYTPHPSLPHHHRPVRGSQGRQTPQCWDHGCNGRPFSTFSNLLRHQRERSGQAIKASCPNCGAVFTRTTARNGHMVHEKCKHKRPYKVGRTKKTVTAVR